MWLESLKRLRSDGLGGGQATKLEGWMIVVCVYALHSVSASAVKTCWMQVGCGRAIWMGEVVR